MEFGESRLSSNLCSSIHHQRHFWNYVRLHLCNDNYVLVIYFTGKQSSVDEEVIVFEQTNSKYSVILRLGDSVPTAADNVIW